MARQTFSNRNEIEKLIDDEHDYEHEAPSSIRAATLFNAMDLSIPYAKLYLVLCEETDVPPDYDLDPDTEEPRTWQHMWRIIRHCEWYHVYNVIEAIYRNIDDLADVSYGWGSMEETFEQNMNKAFKRYKLDWILEDGIVRRTKKKVRRSKESKIVLNSKIARVPSLVRDSDKISADDNEIGTGKYFECISQLAKRLNGAYFTERLSSHDIHEWISQFEQPDRPLMIKLLNGLSFFSYDCLFDELRRIQLAILDVLSIEESELSVSFQGIALCPFGDHPAKSSFALSRLFCESNGLRKDNVIYSQDLDDFMSANSQVQCLVFVDDLLGSGDTIIKMLERLNAEHGTQIRSKNVKVIVATIAAAKSAMMEVENRSKQLSFPVRFVNNHILEKCFDKSADVFGAEEERKSARSVAEKIGRLLLPEHPLGWRNSQLLVVFHYNCPDNTLPIIWKSASKQGFKWRALFERLP